MNKKQTIKLIKASLLLAIAFVVLAVGYNIKPLPLGVNQQKTGTMSEVVIKKSNVDPFLENPTNYSFSCTPTSKGKVLDAKLFKDMTMIIHYESIWKEDGDHSGILKGKYDANKNRFEGFYRTNDNRFYGKQNLVFQKNGEAQGDWDDGYGTTYIRLKQ